MLSSTMLHDLPSLHSNGPGVWYWRGVTRSIGLPRARGCVRVREAPELTSRSNSLTAQWIRVDKWITSWLTGSASRDTKRAMRNTGTRAHEIRVLSGVAGHLTSALDALLLSECDRFVADILELLAVIDGQIAVLEESRHEEFS